MATNLVHIVGLQFDGLSEVIIIRKVEIWFFACNHRFLMRLMRFYFADRGVVLLDGLLLLSSIKQSHHRLLSSLQTKAARFQEV
jgi:hypothetical protein